MDVRVFAKSARIFCRPLQIVQPVNSGVYHNSPFRSIDFSRRRANKRKASSTRCTRQCHTFSVVASTRREHVVFGETSAEFRKSYTGKNLVGFVVIVSAVCSRTQSSSCRRRNTIRTRRTTVLRACTVTTKLCLCT